MLSRPAPLARPLPLLFTHLQHVLLRSLALSRTCTLTQLLFLRSLQHGSSTALLRLLVVSRFCSSDPCFSSPARPPPLARPLPLLITHTASAPRIPVSWLQQRPPPLACPLPLLLLRSLQNGSSTALLRSLALSPLMEEDLLIH